MTCEIANALLKAAEHGHKALRDVSIRACADIDCKLDEVLYDPGIWDTSKAIGRHKMSVSCRLQCVAYCFLEP